MAFIYRLFKIKAYCADFNDRNPCGSNDNVFIEIVLNANLIKSVVSKTHRFKKLFEKFAHRQIFTTCICLHASILKW